MTGESTNVDSMILLNIASASELTILVTWYMI